LQLDPDYEPAKDLLNELKGLQMGIEGDQGTDNFHMSHFPMLTLAFLFFFSALIEKDEPLLIDGSLNPLLSERLTEVFNRHDLDRDGLLSPTELVSLVKVTNPSPPPTASSVVPLIVNFDSKVLSGGRLRGLTLKVRDSH
jgi:hypothetical protein